MKTCTRCHVEKPYEDYSPVPRRSDGRTSWCKPCMAEARRQYRLTPEGFEATRVALKKYQTSPEGRARRNAAKRRARAARQE